MPARPAGAAIGPTPGRGYEATARGRRPGACGAWRRAPRSGRRPRLEQRAGSGRGRRARAWRRARRRGSRARLTRRHRTLPTARPKAVKPPRIRFSRPPRRRAGKVRVARSARTARLASALTWIRRNHRPQQAADPSPQGPASADAGGPGRRHPTPSAARSGPPASLRPALAGIDARRPCPSHPAGGPASRPIGAASGAGRRRGRRARPPPLPRPASGRPRRPRRSPSSPAPPRAPPGASSIPPVRAAGSVIAAGRDRAKRCSWRRSPRCPAGLHWSGGLVGFADIPPAIGPTAR